MILKNKTKNIKLPAFFPDATHGYIKSVGTEDVKKEKVQGLVINTYHLIIDKSVGKIKSFGGIHNFINFKNPIITDSGGFQAMSLIRNNKNNGKITDDGIFFKVPPENKLIELTPEICISTQLEIGSDIVMCLDDCTHPSESLSEQRKSIKRTIEWAKRCKITFNNKTRSMKKKPLIFGIIQGGNNLALRKECADGLKQIGFDGYAFGGWPINEVEGKKIFMHKILKATADLMPDDKPKYAMGVGKPDNIINCYIMGYNLFDCVLPSRDARHKRLYVFKGTKVNLKKKDFYGYIYISSGKYSNDISPISDLCECQTCKNYSRAYIHTLFKHKDPLAFQLATIHNLRFYSDLMRNIHLL